MWGRASDRGRCGGPRGWGRQTCACGGRGKFLARRAKKGMILFLLRVGAGGVMLISLLFFFFSSQCGGQQVGFAYLTFLFFHVGAGGGA
jgi:hypothetical protein